MQLKGIIVIAIFFLFVLSFIPISAQQNFQQYILPNLQGQFLGVLNPNTEIILNVFALPKNMNELLFLMQQLYNGQVKMTRQQILNEFAPTNEINKIASYLSSKGFTIYFKSNFSIMAGAPAYAVESLFNTTLGLYFYNNITYYKPIQNPKIPGILDNVLITGLTNYTTASLEVKPQLLVLGKLLPNGLIVPLKTPYSVPMYTFQFSADYYTPIDLEGFYNVTMSQMPGKNVTVAIIDAFGDPLIYQDIKQFDSMFHLPPTNLTVVPIGPYHPLYGLFTGWYGETALDVEAVHTMAPYANIELVVPFGNTFAAILQAIIYIVSEGNAQVVSMSFGLPENLFSASGLYAYYQGIPFPNYPLVDYYFALGTAEGITFVASSGDEGAYGGTFTTYGGVLFPSSSPFVLSVGGTSIYPTITSGLVSNYTSSSTFGIETAWSVNPLYLGEIFSTVGSGGGYSTFFPSPYWQRITTGSNFRTTPDVSADANPYTGFVIVALGSTMVMGGTSLSAPLWAGVIADLDSYLHNSLGLIAPILYGIYFTNTTLYEMAFHQVTQGFNGKYYASSGYNLVTGLGTPNVGMLEIVVKDYLASHPSLKISVSTFEQVTTVPWYMYNSTFMIIADISYPNGSPVTTGSFSAHIYTLNGYLKSVPLTFNGTYWIGNFTIEPGMPPNIWTIEVSGTSAGISGQIITDIDVGESINIIQPVGSVIPINTPFTVEACVFYPNGTPVDVSSITAEFMSKHYFFNVTLLLVKPGQYEGTGVLLYPNPQGDYIMTVIDPYGSAYTYNYIGEIVDGAVLTPINDGMPSVSPGENFTVLAFTEDTAGLGVFTSQAYAELISPSGAVIEKVPMSLAPDIVQFGVFILFGFHEANLTVPQGLTPGFYKVVVVSSLNTSIGTMYGNFTTFIYISSSTLSYKVQGVTTTYEGDTIRILANITYPNGTAVKYGMFTATFLPASFNFESLIIGFLAGVPMQYNSTLGEWEAVYQIPSEIQGSIYQGDTVGILYGPWNVIIAGVTPDGENVIATYNFNVLPYTYIGPKVVTPSNITQVPFITYNGSTYILQGVYSPSLTITGVNDLVIVNSVIKSLTVMNSNVHIESSTVNEINAQSSMITGTQDIIGGMKTAITLVNSNITLVATIIHNSEYAFNQSANSNVYMLGVSLSNVKLLSTLPTPKIVSVSPANITTATANLTVNITGENLRVLSVQINGISIPYTVSTTSSGILVSFTFNSSLLPDGDYAVNITLSDGIMYSLIGSFYNSFHAVQLSSEISSVSTTLSSEIQSVNSTLKSDVSALNNSITSVSTSLSAYISSVSSSLSGRISSVLDSSIVGIVLAIIGIIIGIIALIRRR